MEMAPLSPYDAPRLLLRVASFLDGGVGGKGKQHHRHGNGNPRTFARKVATGTNHKNSMKSTRAPSSSRGVQWGLSEMSDVATQAHQGPRPQGSDHGGKSQRASSEKLAGGKDLPWCSDSARNGTHHVVKHPDQAGIRVPARGPSHLHPTRGNNLNLAATRSYVGVVQEPRQQGASKGPYAPPPNTGHHRQPNNNSLLC